MEDESWLITGRVITPFKCLERAYVWVSGGTVDRVAFGRPPTRDRDTSRAEGWRVGKYNVVDLDGGCLVPGFIDIHTHGGAGALFRESFDDCRNAIAAHRRQGTTRSLLSLSSAPLIEMKAFLELVSRIRASDDRILGAHLEGPFISREYRGAHELRNLREPDKQGAVGGIDWTSALVKLVTVAPELPGALAFISKLREQAVTVALGHSNATYDEALEGFSSGARIVTHTFNGMLPLHHRDPGIIGAALTAGAFIEVINDGIHLHDATVLLLFSAFAKSVVLITDASMAALADPGTYQRGRQKVKVTPDGSVRVLDPSGTPTMLAGSTLTLAAAVRRAITVLGVDPVTAVNAASLNPATVLGIDSTCGSIAPGRVADFVFMDNHWQVQAVMINGRWLDERRPYLATN